MNSIDTQQLRKKVSTLGFLLLFLGSGAYLVFHSGTAFFRGQTSQNWPTVLGKIDAVIPYSFGSQQIVVWYSYQVDGVPYSGTALDLPHLSADEIYDAAKVDKSIPVHYNPQSPEISVLDPGFAGSRVIWLLAGLLYFSCGAAGIWHHLHRAHTSVQAQLRHAA